LPAESIAIPEGDWMSGLSDAKGGFAISWAPAAGAIIIITCIRIREQAIIAFFKVANLYLSTRLLFLSLTKIT
jgi:hypothetical protein